MIRPVNMETFCPKNTTSEKDVKKLFDAYVNHGSSSDVYGCFEYYFYNSLYAGSGSFYFGFLALPSYYTRFINKYNKVFKNIKISVISEYDIYSFTNDRGSLILSNDVSPSDDLILHKSVLFKVDFSDDYEKRQKVLLGYVLHHSLRMLNLGEGFLSRIEPEHPKNYCSIQKIVDLNNKKLGSRGLSEYEINKEYILLFDDIDTVNNGLRKLNFNNRQTKIVRNIYFYKNKPEPISPKFKDGDLIVALPSTIGRYSYTKYERLLLGMCMGFNDNTDDPEYPKSKYFDLKILKHVEGFIEENTFMVDSLHFRLITDEELLLLYPHTTKTAQEIRDNLKEKYLGITS